jgi:hypothetical protein
MRKYRVIRQEEMEGLAARISAFAIKEIQRLGTVMTISDSQAALFESEGIKRKRQTRRRMGGKSMADWIYEIVPVEEFTTKEAAEYLEGRVPDWKSSRPLDTIRVAMNNDPVRFEKLGDGKYKKKPVELRKI